MNRRKNHGDPVSIYDTLSGTGGDVFAPTVIEFSRRGVRQTLQWSTWIRITTPCSTTVWYYFRRHSGTYIVCAGCRRHCIGTGSCCQTESSRINFCVYYKLQFGDIRSRREPRHKFIDTRSDVAH